MTRQRVLFKSKRRGDSRRVIDNRLTCQRALCNRGKRQGDSPRVIDNPLTCQGALCNRSKRQGGSPRVIDNPLTCQGALCNRSKRQGDDQRAVATDHEYNHGSSMSTVQECDYLNQSYQILLVTQKLFNAYQMLFNAYERLFNALYEKLMVCYEKLHKICDNKVDLGLFVVLKHVREHVFTLRAILDSLPISINESTNPVLTNLLKVYRNVCTQTSKNHILQNDENEQCRVPAIENEILHTERNYTEPHTEQQSRTSDNFGRPSRSQNRDSVHIRKRDREPSRIPMKKLIYLMSKNKTKRRKIKSLIKQFIPKSSSWHNLLSTRYHKCVIQKLANTNMWQFRKPTKFANKESQKRSLKITNKHTSRTRKHKLFKLNNAKIVNTNKCNVQRIKTSDKCLLFVCGDIELNPGPVNTSDMSVLTTRLARIGRKPVNIVGDGNCFFRSVSHQLCGTENHHPQIRALAIQHLINCPEHFVEYNTDQSWLQYLQSMSTIGTWADHIIIQAVANTNSLKINITESALNFSESTVVSSIYTESEGRNVRDIYIGHLDELHYVSTTPITQSFSVQANQTASAKTKSNSRDSQSNLKKSEKRKKYMKEYMKKRRKDNELKKKELERKKSYNKKYKNLNPEKIKESWQKASATYKETNPEKVKESVKRATAKYRKSNPEKVKQSCKTATATYMHINPEKVKESRKQANSSYRKSNPEKVKESSKRATATYMHINPERVKESRKQATALYKKSNPEKVKESSKKATATYIHINPEKVKESRTKATASYRNLNPEKVVESFRNSSRIYNQKYPERVKNIQKKNYIKRKIASTENENKSKQKRLKCNSQDNSIAALHETSDDTRLSISIPKAIELFHKNISIGPEYICTCCDQLWYKSSVTQCNASLYESCSREILTLCLTGLKSIDNTEWICSTCHSNLKAGKLPTCAKANKMTFPEKPDVLKDLTPLEERLISPRIPFMQVRELPRGGQLSIHGM